jgi:hypothetical protein
VADEALRKFLELKKRFLELTKDDPEFGEDVDEDENKLLPNFRSEVTVINKSPDGTVFGIGHVSKPLPDELPILLDAEWQSDIEVVWRGYIDRRERELALAGSGSS